MILEDSGSFKNIFEFREEVVILHFLNKIRQKIISNY